MQHAPKAYQPTGQAAADRSYQNLTNDMAQGATSAANYAIPQYEQNVQAVNQNPYYGQAQSAASGVAAQGVPFGQQEVGAGQGLMALGAGMTPYINSVLQQGYDPQNVAYNRGYQQNSDQVNATNAAYGVAGSPYGAGVAAQSGQNFNTDWRSQQLARSLAALGGASSAGAAAGNLTQQGSSIGESGLNTQSQAGNAPSQAYMQQIQSQIAALQALTQGVAGSYAPVQNAIADQGNYLGIGQKATQLDQSAASANNSSIMSLANFAAGFLPTNVYHG